MRVNLLKINLLFGAKGPVYYGWYIVSVIFLVGFVKAGFTGFLFSIFLKPMSEDFGWTRTMTVGAVTIGTVGAAFLGAAVGPYLDRYGPKYLVSGAAFLLGASAIAVSQVNSLWVFYLFFFVGRAMSQSIMGDSLSSAIVSKWFIRKRGRAVAIASMGTAVGGLILALLVQTIITQYGWRWGWITLGVLAWGLLVLPAFLILKRTPEDMGLSPDGDPNPPIDPDAENNPESPLRADSETQEYSWTRSEAVKTRVYWLLVGILALGTLNATSVTFHLVPYFTDSGISEPVAVTALGTYAVMAAVSLPLWGILSERIGVRYAILIAVALTFTAVALLFYADTNSIAYISAFIIGTGQGGFHLTLNLIWASYFGRRHLGAIMGLALFFQMVGNSMGPITAALIFDNTGSYFAAFTMVLVLQGLMFAMLLIARPPTRREVAESQI